MQTIFVCNRDLVSIYSLLLLLVFYNCISVSSSSSAVKPQIVFQEDENEQLTYSDGGRGKVVMPPVPKLPASSKSQSQSPQYSSGDEEIEALQNDYYDELFYGHQIRDTEKYKRQHGCLCISHLKDPHCGSDNKNYDNGCFFECAQKRNPRLYLRKWGACT